MNKYVCSICHLKKKKKKIKFGGNIFKISLLWSFPEPIMCLGTQNAMFVFNYRIFSSRSISVSLRNCLGKNRPVTVGVLPSAALARLWRRQSGRQAFCPDATEQPLFQPQPLSSSGRGVVLDPDKIGNLILKFTSVASSKL